MSSALDGSSPHSKIPFYGHANGYPSGSIYNNRRKSSMDDPASSAATPSTLTDSQTSSIKNDSPLSMSSASITSMPGMVLAGTPPTTQGSQTPPAALNQNIAQFQAADRKLLDKTMKEIMQDYGKIGGFVIGTLLKGSLGLLRIATNALAMGLSAAKFVTFFSITAITAPFLAWHDESRKVLGALCASSLGEIPKFLAAFSASIANLSGTIDYFRGFDISQADYDEHDANVVHTQDGVYNSSISLKAEHEKDRDKVERMFAGAFATVFFVNPDNVHPGSTTAWGDLQEKLVVGHTGKNTYRLINTGYTNAINKLSGERFFNKAYGLDVKM